MTTTATTAKERPSRIAFGSCNSQNLTQPLWKVVSSRNPTAFVWAGDAIYADWHMGKEPLTFPPKAIFASATPSILQNYYQKQLANPDYQSFLQTTNATIFGTIDDHDMGMNNGDETYPYRVEAGLEFLKFVNEPPHSPFYNRVKKRGGGGVYGVKVFDFDRPTNLVSDFDAGIDPDVVGYDNSNVEWNYSKKSVAIFVLDVRTNKTPWKEGFQGWTPDYQGDFLGETQWKWFETAIARSKATVNVIVSGLQIHPYRFPDANANEMWSHFPTSRQRLYDTILSSGAQSPILVSGDVHLSQIMRKDCVDSLSINDYDTPIPSSSFHKRPLVEVTTSGMTHSWGTCFSSKPKFHNGWSLQSIYARLSSNSFMNFAHVILPMPDLVVTTPPTENQPQQQPNQQDRSDTLFENGGADGGKVGKQFSLELNFAEMEFDWDNEILSLRVFGKNQDAPPLLGARYHFDQLSGKQAMPGGSVKATVSSMDKDTPSIHPDAFKYQMDGDLTGNGRWICTNHKGVSNPLHVYGGYAIMSTFCATIFLLPQVVFSILIYKCWRRQTSKFHNARREGADKKNL
mmetsp:Transcript_15265/g.23761  ORF Transcript_15265/g.23761 Transcript_15265/m.23761 type:complete len:571 (+) Transcript_15265:76-1788(+)